MKTYKYKSIRFAAAALLVFSIAFGAGGCVTEEEEEPAVPQNSQVTTPSDIDNTPVTDNPRYYSGDDPYSVTTMYLTVRTGNEGDNTNHTWSEINSHSTYYYTENGLADRYKVEGMLQVGDESGPLPNQLGYAATAPNATVQVRGQTSSKAAQKSYKIRLKKDKGYWNDQRTIILNKHPYDDSRFRNKLSYDLMVQYPELIGAKTEFVHLYVKDLTEGSSGEFVDYGLYTQVEQMNTRYLRNHGLDENGQLYKSTMFEFLRYADSIKLSTDQDYDKSAFEQVMEIKGSDDHSKLIAMLEDVNNFSIPIEEVVTKHFDEENYLSWLAFQMLTGNTDTTSQNFYLYSPLNGNKWYFISWDNDGAWEHVERIEDSGGGYNYEEGITNYWGSMLHQRMLKSETLRNKFYEKVDYYYSQLTREKIQPLVENYKAVVKKYLFSMPDAGHAEVAESEYDIVTGTILDEIEYNYQMFKESTTRPMPFYINLPTIVDGKLYFSWDNSYDLGGLGLSYTIEVARDYNFQQMLHTESGITVPGFSCDMLDNGQYFYRVTVTNSTGKTQTAMEKYQDINDLKHYGVMPFFVENGNIVAG